MSPAARFIEDLNSELITVKVGVDDDAKEFKLPRALLSKSSPWFEAALKEDRFAEGRTATINLPEDRVDVFELFIYFLYHAIMELDSTDNDIATRSEHLLLCYRTWTFAEKYLLPGLQNCAMHCVCFVFNHEFDYRAEEQLPAATLASCWQASNQGSPLRAILTDYIIMVMQKGLDSGMEQHIPACSGMMQALHASEALLHTAEKGDFPRYKKPVKMSDLLEVSVPEEKSSLSFPQTFLVSMTECGECGFTVKPDRMELRCAFCKKKDCDLHVNEPRLILCDDCYSDVTD